MTDQELIGYREGKFEGFVNSFVDSRLNECGSWDMVLGDGEVAKGDIDLIQDHLRLGETVIEVKD